MSADQAMTAKPRTLKLLKINKGAFYRTCRMLHAYLSAAAFALLMFFAASGFLLNHPQWFGPERTSNGLAGIALDTDRLGRAIAGDDAGDDLADMVAEQMKLRGAFQEADILDDEVYLRFAGVKGTSDVVIDLESGIAEVEVSRANVTSIIHDLHRGKDAGTFWKRLIDVTAILIMAMSLVGLILFLSLRFRLATSMKIMGATLGVFVILFVFLTP